MKRILPTNNPLYRFGIIRTPPFSLECDDVAEEDLPTGAIITIDSDQFGNPVFSPKTLTDRIFKRRVLQRFRVCRRWK